MTPRKKHRLLTFWGMLYSFGSTDPVTGFFRDGCCDTGPLDHGQHTVCAIMTDDFLAMSKYLGNDLSTPHPEFGFKGLKAGDQWCLCAERFFASA